MATATLTALCLYTGHSSLAAKPAMKMKATAGSVSAGKALIAQYRCNGCHNAQLQGRPGFSPSIRKTGALHDYTQAQFVTLHAHRDHERRRPCQEADAGLRQDEDHGSDLDLRLPGNAEIIR